MVGGLVASEREGQLDPKSSHPHTSKRFFALCSHVLSSHKLSSANEKAQRVAQREECEQRIQVFPTHAAREKQAVI